LAAITGYPASTIHHILSTFLAYDYVIQERETRKYALGHKILSLSRTILENIDVRKIAHDDLRQLYRDCNEAVHLAILTNGKLLYIDKVQKQGGLSLATYVGFSTEPHAAAGGKVLLSELAEEEIVEIYPTEPLKKYGPNTITRLEALRQELAAIRKRGYAVDDEEYYRGVRCVSAPIRGGGKIVAAVSITGPIFTVTKDRIHGDLRDMVMAVADRISAKIQW
jgi:DNA-binding IclR family transcriptional regulator